MQFLRSAELCVGLTTLRDLDFSFCVEKTLTPEPNMAEVRIWNLNPNNRKRLADQKQVPVLLKAGYQDSVGLLFRGDLSEVFSQKEGPDWVTTLRSGDGLCAVRSARIQQSFRAGTPMVEILRSMAHTLGISVGDAMRQLEKSALGNLKSSWVGCGPSYQALCGFLKPLGFEVSIQDQSLQILRSQQALEQSVVLLTPDTGLIDSPYLNNYGVLRTQALLNHEVFPGCKIKMHSHEIKETLFRVQRVNFRAETFGEEWMMDIEALKL